MIASLRDAAIAVLLALASGLVGAVVILWLAEWP